MSLKSVILATLVVIAAAVLGIGHESQYVFDPETMHKVAKQALSENKVDDPQVSFVCVCVCVCVCVIEERRGKAKQ